MTHEDAHPHRRRVVAAGIAGNVMEWYDFSVYGYFAAVIGRRFFPAGTRLSRLAAFGAFAAGLSMPPSAAWSLATSAIRWDARPR